MIMTSQTPNRTERFRPRNVIGTLAAMALVLITGWAAFELALAGAITGASEQAERRLALFDRTLEAMIERFHYLPATIAQADESQEVLERPDDPEARTGANGFLSKLNETAGADELFVMDRKGSVVAASNWWTLDSLVGQDFSFRPYFAEAMFDGAAKYYAFGIATSVPGYFLSQRIEGPDGPLGAAVAKINLGEIEANWWRSGELIGILDINNVVILSTRPDWRYRPLIGIDPSIVEHIASQQRYGDNGIRNEGIVRDIWPSRGAEMAFLHSGDPETDGYFLYTEQRLPTHGWRIASFTPMGPLFRDAWTAAAAAALGCAALVLIVVLLIQRRRIVAQRLAEHERLEQRVAERTEDLHTTNEQLRAEIAERVRAENDSRDAQTSLVQAAKLASLGQALAGVAHEVSQPVAALSTHIASAKLLAAQRDDRDIGGILVTMDKVLDRISSLTGHLRDFSRKQTRVEMTCDLSPAISNGLDLVDHKLKRFGVDVHYARHRGALIVPANPVHLEQVMINLLSNAADAMEHTPMRLLSIAVTPHGPMVDISVSDTGEGIAPADIPNIFDPFYTTKEAGRGLGLGLAISYGLIRDIGGAITVVSRPGRGSTFTIRLPLAVAAANINEVRA